MKLYFLKILLILVTFLFVGATSGTVFAEETPRTVLRLYNSDDQLSIIDNELDKGLEMAVHQLGLKVEYKDISKGLPNEKEMEKYYAVIVWLFDYHFKGAEEYWKWQKQQFLNGKRAVLLQQPRPGLIRATGEKTAAELINDTLKVMGFEIGLNYTDFAPDIRIVSKDSSMVEFERKLDQELPHFYESKSLSSENEVFLRLEQVSKGLFSDAIMTGPLGGIIMGDYVYYMDPYTFKKQKKKYFPKNKEH
jgi:hypothetical protein